MVKWRFDGYIRLDGLQDEAQCLQGGGLIARAGCLVSWRQESHGRVVFAVLSCRGGVGAGALQLLDSVMGEFFF